MMKIKGQNNYRRKGVCFLFLLEREFICGLNEEKKIFIILRRVDICDCLRYCRTRGRKRITTRENLNDCHYCPTNYSRSIIQPLFRVGTKSRSINVADPANDTPLFTKYTIARKKCFRSR